MKRVLKDASATQDLFFLETNVFPRRVADANTEDCIIKYVLSKFCLNYNGHSPSQCVLPTLHNLPWLPLCIKLVVIITRVKGKNKTDTAEKECRLN